MQKLSLLIVLVFILSACNKGEEPKANVIKEVEPVEVVKIVDKGGFSDAEICLAALSAEFQWSENPTGGQGLMGDVVGLEDNMYIIKSAVGTYKCALENERVLWANYNKGRWRNGQYDSYITFVPKNTDLIINLKFSDGSSEDRVYKKSLLKRHLKN